MKSPINLQQIPRDLIERLKSETPSFWKKVRNYAALLALITGGAVTAIATSGMTIPTWVTFLLSFIATISGSVAGTATLTKKNDE